MLSSIVLYNSILLFSIIFSYFSEWSKTKYQRLFSRLILFLILFIPAALRYGIGTDYNSYIEIYNWNAYDSLESGFLFIIDACSFLGMSAIQFMGVISFLTLFPICFLLNRKYLSWLIPLYVMLSYFQSYSLVRQALCISFVICSIQYFIDKKYWLSIIFIIIATQFHFSATLIIPFFLIGRIKLNSIVCFVCTLALAFAVLKSDFLDLLFSNPLYQASKYAAYENSSFISDTKLGSGLGVIASTFLPLLFILWSKDIVLEKRNSSLLVILSIFFIFAQILSAKIHIFNRVFDLIRYLPIFLYPALFYTSRNNFRRISIYVCLVISLLQFEKMLIANQISSGSGLGITPYISIFNK